MIFRLSNGLVALLLLTTVCRAEILVDQENFAPGLGYVLDYPGDHMAQTFTLRNSGWLESVTVGIGLSGYPWFRPPIDDLHVNILQTDAAGLPTLEGILATKTIPRSFVMTAPYQGNVELDFSAWRIPVKKGDVLALSLTSLQAAYGQGDNDYSWGMSLNDPLPGGDVYLISNYRNPNPYLLRYGGPTYETASRVDMQFRVTVRTPEPSGLAASAVGVVALVARVRSRRR